MSRLRDFFTYEPWAYIAECKEHGLHGERETCFVCDKPVEKRLMISARFIWIACTAANIGGVLGYTLAELT